MANKPKQASGAERRARIEEMRRQQQAAERRKNIVIIGLGLVLGIGLIAAVAVPMVMKEQENSAPLATIGVSLADASCSEPTNDPATSATHVGPGTDSPAVNKVSYATVPPSNGDHFLAPAQISRHFYTAEDRPRVETLVHNLEHGYTIVWYDSTITGDQLQAARDLADRVPEDSKNRKFIVSAWDDSYGTLPDGKHVALVHWSGDNRGHRQLCGAISGEAVDQFMTAFPASDAREPNAA
jgi:Protein of unknown function (DUF3105)